MSTTSLQRDERQSTPVPAETEDLEHVSSIVPRALRSTRHHRVDYDFLALLNEDFGIDFYSLNKAFMGVPPSPKRQAISLCEWAIRAAKGDREEAGRALRAWAKKNGRGSYNRNLIEAPEVTYEDNDHLRSIGHL